MSQCNSFKISYHPDLINQRDFGGRLAIIKALPPSEFKLLDEVLENHIRLSFKVIIFGVKLLGFGTG